MNCVKAMIRPAGLLIISFILLTLNPAWADQTETTGLPDWCDCKTLDEIDDCARRRQAMEAMRMRQAQCREALGVDLYQNRKGQGARMDACACPCLDGKGRAVEGPYGDRKGAGRPGQATARPLDPEEPEATEGGREP